MKTKLIAWILTAHVLLCQFAFAQTDRGVGNRPAGEKRIALVIGNGAYQKTSELPNPPNDAADMKAALEDLGFEVIYGVDQNARQMKALIRQFGDKLANDRGVGLFFYAGHGLAANGENYLVPVDADIPAEDEIQDATVSLSFLLNKMATAGNRLNIVILDACRNNPFARNWRTVRDASTSGGLATITKAPTGTLIAYATAPGEVASDGSGKNGLYTQELLQQIRQPNLPIEEIFKNVRSGVRSRSNGAQVPWEASSIEGQFYFSGGGSSDQRPNPIPVETGGGNAEEVMWKEVDKINTRLAVESYLSEYPTGRYAATARLKLKVIEAEEQKKNSKNEEESNFREADRRKWEEAERLNTIESYQNYLNTYPNGARIDSAKLAIQRLELAINSANNNQPTINLALGKKTSQSSDFNAANPEFGKSRSVVDGNTESISHTSGLPTINPWWIVDLGAVYDIKQIQVWNRTDCCSERLDYMRIMVRNSAGGEWTPFFNWIHRYNPNEKYPLTFDGPKQARYVMIQLETSEGVLSLAEVVVVGRNVPLQQ